MKFHVAILFSTLTLVACADPGEVTVPTAPTADKGAVEARGPRNGGSTTGNALVLGADPFGGLVALDTQGTPFEVSQASILVAAIRVPLRHGLECDDANTSAKFTCEANHIRLEEAVTADLISSTVFEGLHLPSGSYPSARATVGTVEPEEVTLALSGMVELDGEALNFAGNFSFRKHLFFQPEHNEEIELPDGGSLLIAFDVSQWFQYADITGCIREGALPRDGNEITLGDTTDCRIAGNIVRGVRRATNLALAP